MSKKILRPVLSLAAVGLTIFGGPLGTIVALGAKIGVGALAGLALGVGAAVLLRPKIPRISGSATDRLTASLDPNAPRKIVFGKTALATDIRYQGFTGTDQDYVEWIMAVASHTVEAIGEIWFDSEKAWDSSSGVTSKYSGYLTITTRNPGTSSNGIAIDTAWTSSCTLTGCAYIHLKFKLTGNSKKSESPFSQSIPTRVTVRGKGALLPDLREDGVDATDQSTWDWFDDDSGRNPAWQLLYYLLGWKINDKLAVGRGIPADRIDLDSFVTAANMCDEPVTKAAGGTEPRYRSDAVFSEADDPSLVIGCLCDTMNAVLRDSGGRIGVYVLHNDLATPVCAFTEADIIGEDEWQQTPPIDQTVNIVRGRYVDASDAGLYQLVDYPDVELESVDGIDRIDPFDLPCVQSASQAQRLAKQRLQRNQYRGVFQAKFNYRAWQVNLGDVVTLSHSALGWEDKLFRVAGTSVGLNGVVDLVLKEENEAIYAWDAEEAAPVVPATPTVYDPSLDPIRQAIDDISPAFIQPDPPSAAISRPGTIWLDSDSEPVAYRAYRRVPDPGLLLDNLGNPVLDDEGEPIEAAWTEAELSPADLARWTDITGTGKPEDNADVTAALAGQTALTIAADYTGADLAGELPRTDRYTLTRGGVDVSASSSWTATLVEGDWTGSIDDGLLTTTALGSDTALVDITASYGGFARPPLRVTLTRQYGAAPIGGEGGSSSGGTLVSVPPNGSIASATMAVVSPILAPVVGDAGKVRLSVSLTVSTAPTDLGIYPVAAVLQQNVADVWTDIDTETMSDPHCEVLAVIDESGALRTVKGRLRLGATIEGLTPGDEPEFRLRARNVSGTRTMTLAGTITADGTVS